MDLNEKDSEQHGSLKKTHIVKQSSERISKGCQFMMMSQQSNGKNCQRLVLSQEDSHAKISATQAKEKESLEKEVHSGNMTCTRLGFFDPNTQSLKTYQHSLLEGCPLSLQTLPKLGMMQNGLLYELRISGQSIEEKGFSLLPTVVASDSIPYSNKKKMDSYKITKNGTFRRYSKNGYNSSIGLNKLVTLLPTIGANEYKGSGKNRYKGSKDFRGAKMSEGLRNCETDKIYLNPYFAEVVMGFPSGWTELEPSEIQSFRKLRSSSQGKLNKKKRGG